MRKAISVAALLLALACSTYAGDMPNGSPTPPPSQPAGFVQEPPEAAQNSTLDGIIQNDAPDRLTQIALDLLAVLPSLY